MRRVVLSLLVGAFLFVALLPVLTKLLFAMPSASADFDCDDGTLWMYERVTRLGLKATPMVGDLNSTGERYEDIDHIWLMVELGGFRIALDWGEPWLDRQHYEGIPVSYAELLEFVAMDGET